MVFALEEIIFMGLEFVEADFWDFWSSGEEYIGENSLLGERRFLHRIYRVCLGCLVTRCKIISSCLGKKLTR